MLVMVMVMKGAEVCVYSGQEAFVVGQALF